MDFEGNEKKRVLHFRRTWIKKSMPLNTDCSVADRGSRKSSSSLGDAEDRETVPFLVARYLH